MYGYDNIDYTSGEQDNTLQFEENPCSIGRSHYTPYYKLTLCERYNKNRRL